MTKELSDETIAVIYHCRRELEAAKKLLAELADHDKWNRLEKDAPSIKDAFGRARHFEFGIPSGSGGHRLYQVSPSLAKYVIEAHMAAKTKELAEAHVRARMELDGVLEAPHV